MPSSPDFFNLADRSRSKINIRAILDEDDSGERPRKRRKLQNDVATSSSDLGLEIMERNAVDEDDGESQLTLEQLAREARQKRNGIYVPNPDGEEEIDELASDQDNVEDGKLIHKHVP